MKCDEQMQDQLVVRPMKVDILHAWLFSTDCFSHLNLPLVQGSPAWPALGVVTSNSCLLMICPFCQAGYSGSSLSSTRVLGGVRCDVLWTLAHMLSLKYQPMQPDSPADAPGQRGVIRKNNLNITQVGLCRFVFSELWPANLKHGVTLSELTLTLMKAFCVTLPFYLWLIPAHQKRQLSSTKMIKY